MILVRFPHSDRRTAKLGPAAIIQADDLQVGLPQVIATMANTVERSLPEGHESSFLTDSVVMIDNLPTIAESEIERVIGTLTYGRH